MGARRDLRHDAAIGRMIVDLRQDDIGQDAALAVGVAAHHRGRGLVAGGFDAEIWSSAGAAMNANDVSAVVRELRGADGSSIRAG